VALGGAARYELDNLNRDFNKLNKEVAKLKIVRASPRPGFGTSLSVERRHWLTLTLTPSARVEQAGEDAAELITQVDKIKADTKLAEVKEKVRGVALALVGF
jgi:hypothetical protein